MWSIGDRVLALWPFEEGIYYPAIVCGRGADSFLVQFDDGDRAEMPGEMIRRLMLRDGDRIQGRWRNQNLYYEGVVLEQRGWAIHIRYDDGDEEWTSVCLIRVVDG